MSEANSIPKSIRSKPAKPYPDFPLYAHAAGYWAKKIRGRFYYFGPWDDPKGALEKYLQQKDALHAGRTPREATSEATIHEVVNRFLSEKEALVNAKELSPLTWADYKETCRQLVRGFGKRRFLNDLAPEDFSALREKMAKRWGPIRLGNVIQRIRSVFKFAFESGMIAMPIRFGPGFRRPSKKTLRLAKAAKGPQMFEAEEIRRLLDAAGTPMRAMILLGINCGFGNADCGTLPLSALDLKRGWVNYHRPKTGIDRRCPLWPETAKAIKEALAKRPTPKKQEHAGLVFVTQRGYSWAKNVADSPITKETRKLLDSLDINGRRNFYCLRHTLETIGGESRDQVAVDFVMGHARDDIASVYRERISDERLQAVVDHVRRWLFPADEGAAVILFAKPAAT